MPSVASSNIWNFGSYNGDDSTNDKQPLVKPDNNCPVKLKNIDFSKINKNINPDNTETSSVDTLRIGKSNKKLIEDSNEDNI